MFDIVKFDAPATLRQTVPPRQIALINPTETFTVRTSKSCGQALIKLETGIVTETAMRCLAIRMDDALRFNRVNIPRDCRTVRRAIGLISTEADPSGKRGNSSHTENVLTDLPAAALLKFLPHNLSNSPQNCHNEAGIDPWCVKRIEEFNDLHADKNFRFRDMMAVAGVSERTLYVCFSRWCIVSAKSYLKSVRLNCVPTQPLGLSPKT